MTTKQESAKNRIQILQETLDYTDRLASQNPHQFKNQLDRIQIWLPEDKLPVPEKNPPYKHRCILECVREDSLAAAEKLDQTSTQKSGEKSVLVLNFANAFNPGGGVRHGALAQEEELCRRSTLLRSLESGKARTYYSYHRKLHTQMGSDALMISDPVWILRNPNNAFRSQPLRISVLTAAAPNLMFGLEDHSISEVEDIIYKRIVRMLSLAAGEGYQNLVLGAWGCGAFGNNPNVVSALFEKALTKGLLEDRPLAAYFNHIVFAVYTRTEEDPNLNAFKARFAEKQICVEGSDAFIEARATLPETAVCADHQQAFNRIFGCLLGGAAGDALGYPVEFLSRSQIDSLYGPEGITGYKLNSSLHKAIVSDDTQMSLFTAESLIHCRDQWEAHHPDQPVPDPSKAILEGYFDWLDTQNMTWTEWKKKQKNNFLTPLLMEQPELFASRAPGMTCLSALNSLRRNPLQGSPLFWRLNNSKGCGGVMRTAPCALIAQPGMSEEKAAFESAEAAALTHSHPLGWLPSELLGRIIYRLVWKRDNQSLQQILVGAVRQFLKVWTAAQTAETYGQAVVEDAEILAGLVDRAIDLAQSGKAPEQAVPELGGGWVGEEALAVGVYCALRFEDDFSAALCAAVNHDGDSDSTGAVTGNILGAWLGADAIESKWKNHLQFAALIEETARRLAECGSDSSHQ